MFESLSNRLTTALSGLTGKATLSDDNISATLREVRLALLEADVALEVVLPFLERVRERALGMPVTPGLAPSQAFVRIVHDELIEVMGGQSEGLALNAQPPAVILMAGLQGVGKTTTAAKIGGWLARQQQKKVMLASTDVYRPAAMEQLARLAETLSIDYFEADEGAKPSNIAKSALQAAKTNFADVLIIDTAGRLHNKNDLMNELSKIIRVIKKIDENYPTEIVLVLDGNIGQNSVKQAEVFKEICNIDSIIITKLDGTAKGGVLIPIAQLLNLPISFIGTGEQKEDLINFRAKEYTEALLDLS